MENHTANNMATIDKIDTTRSTLSKEDLALSIFIGRK
jgi:hypothetical protein